MDEFYLLALTTKDGSRFSYASSAHSPDRVPKTTLFFLLTLGGSPDET
jgi:hypothetical protein